MSQQLYQAVVLTALDVEYRAVRAHLSHLQEEVHAGGTVYERGSFSGLRQDWEVSIAQVGAGNAPIALEVERAISRYHPHAFLFVGVAGGLKDVRLGDVVAGTKVYCYETGKHDGEFHARPEVAYSAYQMVSRARIEASNADWQRRIKGVVSAHSPRAFVAPIAAGDKVIASMDAPSYRLLRTQYDDAIAVEMEAYGFLRALYANPSVPALIIRGISDLISNKREADAAGFQDIAARHASAFAFEILAKLTNYEAHSIHHELKVLPESTRLEVSPSGESRLFTINNSGGMYGSTQIGNYNTFHSITNVSSKDDVLEGKTHLRRGLIALSTGAFHSACSHLEEALRLLPQDQFSREAARAYYLLALACLGGKRPFGVTLQEMQRLEELLQMAIRLHSSSSYLYTLALFKRDFARNGWHQPRYLREWQELMGQAQLADSSTEDEENLNLLAQCLPHLMRDAQQW